MDTILNPYLLYALIVLGGVGVCLALPRGRPTPQFIGAGIAALAGGLVILFLGLNSGRHYANVYFYVFSAVGLGAALRVITHPRPVYAALYFVLTVLAASGLFLILSAEFMAFALVIVYAGAILITYLFVIMLATQAPEEGELEKLAEYDTQAREPLAATVVGFLLLAVLTTMLFGGVRSLPTPAARQADLALEMPRKAENVLRARGLLKSGDTLELLRPAGSDDPNADVIEIHSAGSTTVLTRDQWPEELKVANIESLGFNLLRDHPGTIEIAGVILLMAMLGAVVLSRRQVQMDEEAKMRQARHLAGEGEA